MKPIEEVLEEFEANMLDGDKLTDCGGAMISAEACFEYLTEAILQRDQEWLKRIEEIVPEEKTNIITKKKRLTYSDVDGAYEMCRQEILNNIKELKK